ncbi:hypothetical protein H0X48_00705 [Candidatus Dependentiae bacterium]|nr:hypothetical protein [Candidatus Dependentiae bacterium]
MIKKTALIALLSTNLLSVNISFSMEEGLQAAHVAQAPELKKTISPERMAQLLQRAQQTVDKAAKVDTSALLARVEKARQARAAAESAAVNAQIKSQNTLLTSFNLFKARFSSVTQPVTVTTQQEQDDEGSETKPKVVTSLKSIILGNNLRLDLSSKAPFIQDIGFNTKGSKADTDQDASIITLGVYKRDIIEAGLAVAQITAETLFYKRVQQRMICHIVDSIENDTDKFLELLEATHKGLIRCDKLYNEASFLNKVSYAQSRNSMLSYLHTYVKKNHTYQLPLNPIKSNIFFDSLALMAATKGLEKLPDKLIAPCNFTTPQVNTGIPNLFAYLTTNAKGVGGNLQPDNITIPQINTGVPIPYLFQTTYAKDAEGNLQPIYFWQAPPSAFSVIKGLANPRLLVSKVLSGANSQMAELLNNRLHLGLPKWVYSDGVHYLTDYMTLVYGAQIFTSNALDDWSEYLETHLEKEIKLVKKYKRARDEKNEPKAQKRLVKIKNFVLASYKDKSILPCSLISKWWKSKNSGQSRINTLITLPAYGLLAYKAYKTYNYFFGSK